MKFILTLLLSYSILSATAQIDYCTELRKAHDDAATNFANTTAFEYIAKDGSHAYKASFSFVSNTKGLVFKKAAAVDTRFFQVITTNAAEYASIYKSIETCLVRQTERWTKVDGREGNGVIFTCNKTGVSVILISGKSGVTVQIDREESKSKPVFNPDFCVQLEKLALACNDGFKGFLSTYKDSSAFLGKRYDANVVLNQRAKFATISLGTSLFDKTKPDNNYLQLIDDGDMSYNDIVKNVEACLTTAKGWVKDASKPEAINFKKDKVKVSITQSQSVSPGETASNFVRIGTDTGF
jgi:hypothetical protein